MKKSIVSFIIILIIIETFFPSVIKADSIRYEYNGNTAYPGYKERIDAIKANHPNWKFIIMETKLDWEDVIENEYTGHHVSPKNLIQGKSGGWICSICGQEIFDTGNWMCASEQAIRYYMDPRNWLVDSPYLFQFLQTNYAQTTDANVYSALNGTFLYSWENASLINRVCMEADANPYFIIARIIQEQGNKGGITYRMQDTDGTIYYNLFNIGAGGNGNEVYENALKKAKEMGWTSIEACIRGGIKFLLSSYIGYKQNTIYLNKFDVEEYRGLYTKQYMQNIEAPKSEATSMYNKMKQANLLDKDLTFVIPVYENMPSIASSSPEARGELYPKNIRVKPGHSRITIRAGKSTSTSVLGYINDSDTVILSVERFNDGWHRIILTDGTQGFIKFNSDYLEEINDIVNCREDVIVQENVSLKVGPGAFETEVTMLSKGETIARIENSGMYNFDGQIWDRVRISDGRQGFVQRKYLRNKNYDQNEENGNTIAGNEIDNGNNTNENEIESGNNTNQNEIEDVNNINQNGIEGGNTSEKDEVNDNNTTNSNEAGANEIIGNQTTERNEIVGDNTINSNETNSNQTTNEIIDNNDIEENNVNNPNANETGNNTNNPNGNEMGSNTSNPNENETNSIDTGKGDDEKLVLGDVNGDGFVKANDYLIIKDYIMEKTTINDKYLKSADVTKDGYVKANDYLKIKDHIMYGIEL